MSCLDHCVLVIQDEGGTSVHDKAILSSKEGVIPEGTDAMNETSLITQLREYLEDKRYAVVFYDVWKLEFWKFIKYVLLENKRCSNNCNTKC